VQCNEIISLLIVSKSLKREKAEQAKHVYYIYAKCNVCRQVLHSIAMKREQAEQTEHVHYIYAKCNVYRQVLPSIAMQREKEGRTCKNVHYTAAQ